jgi:opacity protein-like surface antigen/outer membrane protease
MSVMRRWAVALAAVGLAHGAGAGELDSDILRGSIVPTYRVVQTPAQAPYRAGADGDEPSYALFQPPAQEPNAAPYQPVVADPIAPVWTGFYIGGQFGAAAGTADFSDPFGTSIYGDKVSTPGFLAGGQIGYNWQVPNSPWVFGFEASLAWLDSDGTNTCLAFSGFFVSANCRAQPNVMGDLTARVGWAYGQSGHSLIYAKGGAAAVHTQIDMTTNATASFVGLAPQVSNSSFTKVGWTAGAGVEHAIAPAWSVKVEYDYIGLASEAVATPLGIVQVVPGNPATYFLTSATTSHVSQNYQQVKLGLNYRIGEDPAAQWDSAPSEFPAKAPVLFDLSAWQVEIGARYWFSRGRFQKDLGSTTNPALADILNSRLTYDSTTNSGEFFSRLDAPLNLFVKGNIGAGSISGGQLNDEDWVLFGGTIPYSNTISKPVNGEIDFATIDLGYDFVRDAGSKLGAFVGYNYYREDKSAHGCSQIANPLSDCVPALPDTILVITENNTWKSLRVGVNGETMITDQLKIGADVAYLPYVVFYGTDNHVLRNLISPESAKGRGLQLESVLSYLVTERFSVGVGGRYWAMWSTKDAITEFGGAPCPCQTLPVKTERYGVFLQAAYRFGGLP